MKKIINILIFFISLLYPFSIVFFTKYKFYVLALLIFAFSIDYLLSKNIKSLLLAFIFSALIVLQNDNLLYFYPVGVNLVFMFIFAYSLKEEAIITRLAKLKDKNLPSEAISYTRNLTKIWIGFFTINLLITLMLIAKEDKTYWAYYCGIISYVIMGCLFIGEYIYRKVVLKV